MTHLRRRRWIALLVASGMLAVAALPRIGPTRIASGAGGQQTLPHPHGWRSPASVAAGEPLTLTILHTNDFHAHVDEWASRGITYGGSARLATEIQRIRATDENVLLLDAGDQFQGTLFFNVFKSDVLTATMNALGYDAMTLGNHEFDDGQDELARFVEGVAFPVVSANTDVADPLSPLAGKIRPTAVITVAGQPIGLIGLTTPDTVELSSPGEGIFFRDPVDVARNAVADLTGRGIDKIIALTHLGYHEDLALARTVSGLDVIVGGHSHTFLYTPPTEAAGPYPTVVEAPDGKPALVVTANEWGKYLGHLTVRFDAEGTVAAAGGNPILLDATVAPDPTVEALVAGYRGPVEELRRTVIGESAVDIPIKVGDTEVCRVGECLMGNLVTDAVMYYGDSTLAEPPHVVILNGGGFRAPIDVGPVSVGEVMEVLPYGNTVATFLITGTHIVEALENGVSLHPANAGRFPQVSGMRFGWDPDRPVGSRITSVDVLGPTRDGDWTYQPLDEHALYYVATNNYMRGGGDGYTMFRDHAIDPYDFGPALDEVVVDYITANSPIAPALEGRIHPPRWTIHLPLAMRSFTLPSPTEPPSAEEYAIYGTVIQQRFFGPDSRLERFVVDDATVRGPLGSVFDQERYEYVLGEMPELQEATYRDLMLRNRAAWGLADRFDLSVPVVLLDPALRDDIFRAGGWDEFYRRYPGSQGITELSRVGFSPDGRQALLYLGTQSHYLAGIGHLYLLTRSGEEWVVTATAMMWIS